MEHFLSESAPPSANSHDYDAAGPFNPSMSKIINLEDDDEDGEGAVGWWGCRKPKTILGIKTNTMVRLLKVCSAFPFVIVVAALNFSNKYAFLRSVTGIRTMNILIYVAPVVYGEFR